MVRMRGLRLSVFEVCSGLPRSAHSSCLQYTSESMCSIEREASIHPFIPSFVLAAYTYCTFYRIARTDDNDIILFTEDRRAGSERPKDLEAGTTASRLYSQARSGEHGELDYVSYFDVMKQNNSRRQMECNRINRYDKIRYTHSCYSPSHLSFFRPGLASLAPLFTASSVCFRRLV